MSLRLFGNDVLYAVEMACAHNKPKALQSLLKKHPTLIKKYRTQISPSLLHSAVRDGHPKIIDLIIQSGIDVNHLGGSGLSPLYIAIIQGMMDMAKYLIAKGASPHIGQPIFATIMLKDERLAIRFIKLLIDAGIELDRKYPWIGDKKNLVSALDIARANERKHVIKFLEKELAKPKLAEKPQPKASKKKKASRS
jgi:ankyrin repeat protein